MRANEIGKMNSKLRDIVGIKGKIHLSNMAKTSLPRRHSTSFQNKRKRWHPTNIKIHTAKHETLHHLSTCGKAQSYKFISSFSGSSSPIIMSCNRLFFFELHTNDTKQKSVQRSAFQLSCNSGFNC